MSNNQVPTLLITYPVEFGSREKFNRKVSAILANLERFKIVYFADEQGFIREHFAADNRLFGEMRQLTDSNLEGITHAIIFNDGASFNNLLDKAKSSKVRTRIVETPITKVVNIDKEEKCDIYIGRGSRWGNPYAIGFDGDREEVIRKFKYDFDRGFLRFDKNDLLMIRGKVLGCHCKPAACHGDVIADYLNSLDDSE